MSRSRSISANLADGQLSVLAAAIGLAVSLALLPVGLLVDDILVRGVPVSIGAGCLFYLLSTRHAPREWSGAATSSNLASLAPRLVVIGLASLVTIAAATGGRTLPFLLLAWAVGSLLIAQIIFAEPLDRRVVLVEIVLFAAVVRFAALYTTPGFIGIDIWTHVTSFAAAIQTEGSLSAISGTKYSMAPFYHLIAAAAADLLGVPLRTAIYLVLGTVMPLTALLVYATARYVIGIRWALLATVLFVTADRVIQWGITIETTSLGLAFFLVVLLFLARAMYAEVGRTDAVLMALFAVAVTLTHQVSAFITMVLLGTATAAQFLSRRVSRYVGNGTVMHTSRYLPAVFGIHFTFTAFLWSITPWEGGVFILRVTELFERFVREAGFLALLDPTPSGVGGGQDPGLVGQLATYVNHLGLFVLLLVATIGSLALLRRARSAGTYALVGGILAMLVFTLGLPLFGITLQLPERWYAFVYTLMAVVGAAGIKHVAGRLPPRSVAAGLVVFLLLFPGTMVMAQNATYDDPTFEDQWIKNAYTESEIAAAETFRETVPEANYPVRTDAPYFQMVTRINEDPAARAGADYQYLALWLAVTEGGRAAPFQDVLVYRTYQSVGHTQFSLVDGSFGARQLTREQVCPRTRNHVYTTDDVVMCVDRDE